MPFSDQAAKKVKIILIEKIEKNSQSQVMHFINTFRTRKSCVWCSHGAGDGKAENKKNLHHQVRYVYFNETTGCLLDNMIYTLTRFYKSGVNVCN